MDHQEDQVANWIRSNVVVAEDLLSRVAHMRAEGRPSRFEVKCGARLTTLYGDFIAAIKMWEGMLAAQGTEHPTIRRAVTSAYYSKAGRKWSGLSFEELVRTSELMEQNLHEDPTSDRDVRVWFQAYKRLPDFSYLQALDRLEAWAARSDSVEAHYYCYVLHYLQWSESISRTETQVMVHLDRCVELAVGRRGHSYEWLATGPAWCPLVNFAELGGFNRQKGFYNDDAKLTRAEGIIESMKGPQSGLIRIGQSLRAFFVPGTEFWESQHINAVVNFHLGFAYGGLRAWRLTLGRIGSLPSAENSRSLKGSTNERISVTQPTSLAFDGAKIATTRQKLEGRSSASAPRRAPTVPDTGRGVASRADETRPSPTTPKPRENKSIYVGNIPFTASEEDLTNVFRQFGAVQKVTIPMEGASGWMRGYAFVDFDSSAAATAALNYKKDLSLGGRTLRVNTSKLNPK